MNNELTIRSLNKRPAAAFNSAKRLEGRPKSLYICTAIYFCFIFLGCYSSSATPKAHESPSQKISSQINSPEYHLLDSAFRDSSREGRRAFFDGWLRESDSIRSLEHPKDSIRQIIYELFIDIYKPDTTSFQDFVDQTKKIPKDKEDGVDADMLINFVRNTTAFYRDARFIVIQSNTPFRVYSDNEFDKLGGIFSADDKVQQLFKDNVSDFAPPVSYYDKHILILTKKYKGILDEFMSNSVFENESASNEAKLRMQHAKRAFLLPGIEISINHWWGWHYTTFPEVFDVQFNESLSKAIINFRSTWNGGGIAKYEKQGGKWVQKEYNPNAWIE